MPEWFWRSTESCPVFEPRYRGILCRNRKREAKEKATTDGTQNQNRAVEKNCPSPRKPTKHRLPTGNISSVPALLCRKLQPLLHGAHPSRSIPADSHRLLLLPPAISKPCQY